MYVIRGKYPGQAWEDIDEFDSREETEKMLAEYQLAYGSEWLFTIKKRKTINEYDKLIKAEKTCHTIEVREKATGKVGVANTYKRGVQVFYGADDGSDDKTISPEIFSRDFEITAEIRED